MTKLWIELRVVGTIEVEDGDNGDFDGVSNEDLLGRIKVGYSEVKTGPEIKED